MATGRSTSSDDRRLLELIYDAPYDERLWAPVLEEVADRAGAGPANLLEIDVLDGHGSGWSARTPEETVATYFATWAHANPLGLVEDAASYAAGWQPRILRDADWMDRKALERSGYHADFLVPIDAAHMLIVRLSLAGTRMTSIGLGRPGEAFDDDEIAALSSIHPHLIRADRMRRALGLQQAQLDQIDVLVRHSPDALFFLNEQRRIVRRTEAAEALLSRGVIRLEAGRLPQLPGTVHHPRTGEAWAISTAPMGPRSTAGFSAGRCLLVSARPLAPPPERRLATLYGLTPAEARLALRLAVGDNLRDIANATAVSIHTVRNQLAAVFDKTGCRRQADLVRLLVKQ